MVEPPRIVCIVPALPNEVRLDTLRSIFFQTVPVSCVIILTEKIKEHLPFPAKISKVMNNMLVNLKIENYDYLLRVDADTVLPLNFIEENLKAQYDVLGFGSAQLIAVPAFRKCMNGLMHPDHDDGYPLFRFPQCGFKATLNYKVEPVFRRRSGLHRGSAWFVSQGELHYRYGYDILYELAIVLGKWKQYHPYGLFFFVGYFKALFQRKKLFDAGEIILRHNLLKYRHPLRFLKIFKEAKYRNKILRVFKI